MTGIIIKIISNDFTVLIDEKQIVCKARGKLRNLKQTPTVGDKVKIDLENKYILEILPRKNQLIRPPISNIDQAIIITSLKEPKFSSNLLDKLLTIIEYNSIKPIICFTKLDLLESHEIMNMNKQMDYYKKIGYEIYSNDKPEEIKQIFKNKTSVFTGQTGAGKSTLLNLLDSSLNLKTNEISKALGRGKHTTRHVELINIHEGWVADTPGFSDISFAGMSDSDIRDNFIEFNNYKDKCKYRDCMHNKEDDCFIKDKVNDNTILKSRYENYLKFINSFKNKY